MPMTRTTISFTREGMQLIQEAAKRQGISVSQFVREAALMRATMAADDNPYPMRALAAQLRAIGDQGYALAEKARRSPRGRLNGSGESGVTRARGTGASGKDGRTVDGMRAHLGVMVLAVVLVLGVVLEFVGSN